MKLDKETLRAFDRTDIGMALSRYERAYYAAVEADTRDAYPTKKFWDRSEQLREELVKLLVIQTLGIPFKKGER